MFKTGDKAVYIEPRFGAKAEIGIIETVYGANDTPYTVVFKLPDGTKQSFTPQGQEDIDGGTVLYPVVNQRRRIKHRKGSVYAIPESLVEQWEKDKEKPTAAILSEYGNYILFDDDVI
jgi:hypothetical protein